MDTITYVAITLGLIALGLLIYSALITVKYKKLVAFVNAAGLILTGEVKEVKPEELLKQIITQLEVIGGTEAGRKLADAVVAILIPHAKDSVKKGLEEWAAQPWDEAKPTDPPKPPQ